MSTSCAAEPSRSRTCRSTLLPQLLATLRRASLNRPHGRRVATFWEVEHVRCRVETELEQRIPTVRTLVFHLFRQPVTVRPRAPPCVETEERHTKWPPTPQRNIYRTSGREKPSLSRSIWANTTLDRAGRDLHPWRGVLRPMTNPRE